MRICGCNCKRRKLLLRGRGSRDAHPRMSSGAPARDSIRSLDTDARPRAASRKNTAAPAGLGHDVLGVASGRGRRERARQRHSRFPTRARTAYTQPRRVRTYQNAVHDALSGADGACVASCCAPIGAAARRCVLPAQPYRPTRHAPCAPSPPSQACPVAPASSDAQRTRAPRARSFPP